MRQPVEPEGGKTQLWPSASSACFRSGPAFAEGIMASGVCVPHQQVEHTAAPTKSRRTSKNSLANGEPSTQGQSLPYLHTITSGAVAAHFGRSIPKAVIGAHAPHNGHSRGAPALLHSHGQPTHLWAPKSVGMPYASPDRKLHFDITASAECQRNHNRLAFNERRIDSLKHQMVAPGR